MVLNTLQILRLVISHYKAPQLFRTVIWYKILDSMPYGGGRMVAVVGHIRGEERPK